MASIKLNIGRIVWHGEGAPDVGALSSAIGQALEQTMVGAKPVVVAPGNATTECAQAVARQVLPRLSAVSGAIDG